MLSLPVSYASPWPCSHPSFNHSKLFGFFMQSVFVAPFAVLHHFDTFGRILLVLVCTIIAALAFCACKSNSFTHSLHLTQSFSARGQLTCLISISQAQCTSQQIFANFAFKKAGPSQRNYCNTSPHKVQFFIFDFYRLFYKTKIASSN